MCGIIGYIGKNVEQNLLSGLEKLEYRGYDSAGFCVLRDGEFYVEKSVGSVQKLLSKTFFSDKFGVGIAHTRWATHGEISICNTHPHFSSKGDIAIVHNGIIENFECLKEELEINGIYFYGQSDSEVVAKLLNGKLNIKKIKELKEKLSGTYALAIISKKNKNIYFLKNKSPLYVGIGKDCSIIASDPSCFIGKCERFFPIDDGEFGQISLNKVDFFNDKEKIIKKSKKLNLKLGFDGKGIYDHFMLKEINESESVIENIIKKYNSPTLQKLLKGVKNFDFNRIYLVGCGTAYHAALLGERYFSKGLNIDVYCEMASEFQYKNYQTDKQTLCIFISQSGETIDTITALDYAKEKGARVISITNVEYSTIATKAEINLPIFAGREVAVASTKAYLAQCIVLYILAKFLSNQDFKCGLQNFRVNLNFGDDEKIKNFAKEVLKNEKVIFIGRGMDYITALEASLKLKEVSYINSIAEPCGELKHGPIALVDERTLIICIATDKSLFAKTLNNAYETKTRGGKLAILTDVILDKNIEKNFEYVFNIKDIGVELNPLQSMITLQKLAYYVAKEKGTNPDKPKNLAKSVTVE